MKYYFRSIVWLFYRSLHYRGRDRWMQRCEKCVRGSLAHVGRQFQSCTKCCPHLWLMPHSSPVTEIAHHLLYLTTYFSIWFLLFTIIIPNLFSLSITMYLHILEVGTKHHNKQNNNNIINENHFMEVGIMYHICSIYIR